VVSRQWMTATRAAFPADSGCNGSALDCRAFFSGVCGDRECRAHLGGWSANALDGAQQRQVQHVTLRMATTESLREHRQAREQRYRERVIAAPECDQRAACREA
jgi:hypothetical protein